VKGEEKTGVRKRGEGKERVCQECSREGWRERGSISQKRERVRGRVSARLDRRERENVRGREGARVSNLCDEEVR